jgi:hypothetical protein
MKNFYLMLGALAVTTSINAQNIVNITDASLVGGQTYNWTKNNVYLVDGLTFLEEGGILNIEAGTVIKFTPRADVGNPSALVICRGAKIFANGTAAEPIIFTAQDDDVTDPTDLGPEDVSLWGGLVILGKGYTEKNGNTEVNVEGIPTSEPRGVYGMPAGQAIDNDNSGVLRYVSIRHGGREIATGSELNGLTLGAVGSGTTLEYIEIYANSDDGIEFFGGACNLKYAVVAFSEDDSFDWDESWTGKGQFWFSIKRSNIADTGWECDGSTPDDVGILSNPVVFNATNIGSGVGASASNPVGFLFRAGTKGYIANSIVADFKGKGIEIQDKPNNSTTDAFANLQNGTLIVKNNIFWKIGSNTTIDTNSTSIIRFTANSLSSNKKIIADSLVAWGNQVVPSSTSLLNNISRIQNQLLDPRPQFGSIAETASKAAYPNDPFFTPVNFIGAFSSNGDDCWIKGWTTLAKNNHLANFSTGLNNKTESLAIAIYPNPTYNNITIVTDEAVNVSFVNVNGQVIKTLSLLQGNNVVNVSDLAKGIYIVKIVGATNTQTHKLIVE